MPPEDDTTVSQTPGAAAPDPTDATASQTQVSQPGADGSRAAAPDAQEPETVEALKQRLADLQEANTRLQSTKDAQLAASNARLSELVRRANADKSKAEQDALIRQAKDDPEAFAETFLARVGSSESREAIELELGQQIIDRAWADPAYADIPEADRRQIATNVQARGGGAVDIVNAWAGHARTLSAAPLTEAQQKLDAAQKRLAAMENGATGEEIDKATGPVPADRQNRESFDLATVSGILAARNAGKIDEGEASKRMLALIK